MNLSVCLGASCGGASCGSASCGGARKRRGINKGRSAGCGRKPREEAISSTWLESESLPAPEERIIVALLLHHRYLHLGLMTSQMMMSDLEL